MKKNELVSRIEEMENSYDCLKTLVEGLNKALADFEAAGETVKSLEDYLDSGKWKKDFEADEAGLLPEGLKRGVLSEDGLYDLLEEVACLKKRLS